MAIRSVKMKENKKNVERNLFANQSSQILMKELKNNNLEKIFLKPQDN